MEHRNSRRNTTDRTTHGYSDETVCGLHRALIFGQTIMDINAVGDNESELEFDELTSVTKTSGRVIEPGGPSRNNLQYGVEDNPPPHMAFLFGLQQVLLSISSIISIPLMVANEICAGDLDLVKSKIVSTSLFMSGVCTLLQATIGIRLPIIQGGCYKFVPAVIALMALPAWKCPDIALPGEVTSYETNTSHTTTSSLDVHIHTNVSDYDELRTEIWQSRMREIQGGIMVSALVQVFIGCTGILGWILHYIGPITVIPTITLVGLSLVGVAQRFCQVHWGVSSLTLFLVLLFSLYLSEVRVPFPAFNRKKKCHINWYPVFKLLPVMLAVLISWGVCGILTITNSLSTDPNSPTYNTRTDARTHVMDSASWFFFPYPAQWGIPTITVSSFVAMLAATITSIIESLGDYYACARISRVEPPPAHAVNRGVAMEGFGSILSGIVGSGGGTTSYSQNVGAIGFTKVASRRAFQAAGLIFVLCGICGKFGAILTLLPDPVLGGIVLVSLGMVASVGLSNLQFVNLNSSRNLVIIGASLIIGLMVPRFITSNHGCIQTGNEELDGVLTVLMSTVMFVGGFIAFVLDNTVPGTIEERGVKAWRKQHVDGPVLTKVEDTTYDLPLVTRFLKSKKWALYVPFLPSFDQSIYRFERCRCRKKNRKNYF